MRLLLILFGLQLLLSMAELQGVAYMYLLTVETVNKGVYKSNVFNSVGH